MSCQRHHIIMFLWGVIFSALALSIPSQVDGAFVIINQSGRDLEADCGDLRWTISVGERTVVTAAIDGGLEVLGPSELFTSMRHRQPSQMCRVEAGNCFLSWDPVKLSPYYISEVNNNGDYEWEVDKTGVSLMLHLSRTRSRSGGLDWGREYEMLWQPASPLFSGATQCMCASPSSPLARAFYSVLLYFRE